MSCVPFGPPHDAEWTEDSGAVVEQSGGWDSTITFSDGGTLAVTADSWSRSGRYYSSSRIYTHAKRTEDGELRGDGISGTYHKLDQSSRTVTSSDKATYLRSPNGFSSNGKYSSTDHDTGRVERTESGTQSVEGGTLTLAGNLLATHDARYDDSGTYYRNSPGRPPPSLSRWEDVWKLDGGCRKPPVGQRRACLGGGCFSGGGCGKPPRCQRRACLGGGWFSKPDGSCGKPPGGHRRIGQRRACLGSVGGSLV
jgi:hypothetical protein